VSVVFGLLGVTMLLFPKMQLLMLFFSKACLARASLREVGIKVHNPKARLASCHRRDG